MPIDTPPVNVPHVRHCPHLSCTNERGDDNVFGLCPKHWAGARALWEATQ